MLVRSPELADWAATFGTRTLGGRVPVTLADHVRIGSNTKTWTGTVILQLVQEGKLRLDEPVAKYRPDVPNGQNITITHLLDMRSGLYNYSESLELNQTLDTNPTKVWAPDELLGIAYKYPPYFPPGQGYHYSNTNTVLLGLIIEKLTGNPVEQEFQSAHLHAARAAQHAVPAADLQRAARPVPERVSVRHQRRDDGQPGAPGRPAGGGQSRDLEAVRLRPTTIRRGHGPPARASRPRTTSRAMSRLWSAVAC